MKKIFFALAALVLAFTGCSQEEDAIQVSEKKAVKVVVNMDKPGFGEDTRAPRTEWVAGDKVVVVLGEDLEHLIALMYDGTSWEEVVLSFVDGEWEEVDEAEGYLADLTNGSLKAIYCSSGISSFAPIPDYATAAAQLTGIDIISYARINKGYDEDLDEYFSKPLGECIMTCEDGTYSASSGVLTLNILMIPQVAQFTIKDLSIADNLNVYATGPFNFYAGGTITSAGVGLTPLSLSEAGSVYCHDNEDGISFYVAPWQSEEDMPEGYDDEYYVNYFFSVYDDGFTVDTYREFPFTQVAIGDAVIFDGPYTVDEDGEPTAGAQKWEFYE